MILIYYENYLSLGSLNKQVGVHLNQMKSLLNIFNSIKNRKSIPNSWCGLWTDKNGKQVIIKSTKHDFYTVTVLGSKGQAFEIELLGGNTKNTIELIGRFATDTSGNSILQVEAGSNDIGPTYNLYFLTAENNEKLRHSKNSDDLDKITIKPDVGMGLYDDWEGDLGVPWAFPLDNFKKKEN